MRGGHQQRRAAGFTLVELTISAALMAVILAAAYACFSAALAGRRTIESRADLLQGGRVALDLITADLRSACELCPSFAFLGMDRHLGDVEADNLDFATRNIPAREVAGGDWCEVSYFVEADPRIEGYTLWRRRDATPDNDPLSGGSREEILRGVTGVRFEYYDGFEWFDEWGDETGGALSESSWAEATNLEGMPDAVRITLWLDSAESPTSTARGERPKRSTALMMQGVAYLNLSRLPSAAESSSGEGEENVVGGSGERTQP